MIHYTSQSLTMQDILGIYYYFGDNDRNDQVFDPSKTDLFACGFVIKFKDWIESHYDAAVHTWDCVDANDPSVKAVLYFDYSWRYARQDPFLRRIPFAKRALMIIEPSNVNPSLYFLPFYRNRFSTIFTWDEKLLKTHPSYHPVNVPVGAEPATYRENPFSAISFNEKKNLVAVSRNCWSYMPQSTYRKRVRAYRHFAAALGDGFDLFGQGWNRDDLPCYRGPIADGWDDKVSAICRYKFAICFENNASQPGYISEKILDCFCARCVPIYYGSKGVEKRITRDCFIDYRDFRSLDELKDFILNMSEAEHRRYLDAIEGFLHSPALGFFSTAHYFRALADGIGLKPRQSAAGTSS